MAGLTWLHLSDWHQKGKDFDRDVVKDALLKDIQNRAQINADLAHIDFIIFSGDVAFSGQAEEYQAAKEHLFNPVLKATGLDKNRLFIVPGNHDLDYKKFKLLNDEVMHPLDLKEQVKTWLEYDDYRHHLLQPFATYKQFVMEFIGQDQADYASIQRFNIDGKDVALLGLNSALMCGRKKDVVRGKEIVNDYGWLVVGEPQVYYSLQKISDADIRIAVLHHPFSWLTEFDNDDVEYRLRKECHFILCGHRHRPSVKVEGGIAGDCVIIPAGASYDNRIAEDPRFTNAYNFVHLDFTTTQAVVYLRRWSESQKKFIEDTDSYEGGRFQFDFHKSLKKSVSSSQKVLNHSIPYIFRVKGKRGKKIALITGRIEQVHEADVWVSSENTNMEMARPTDRSISGVIRYRGAKKDHVSGIIIDDIIANELKLVVGGKVPVAPTKVFVTGSGELGKDNNVKKIIHVASVRGEPGEGYEPVKNIQRCIQEALKVADSEDCRVLEIKSILFPLLGAGTAEGNVEDLAQKLITSALEYFEMTKNSALEYIYFIARTDVERNACHKVLQELVQTGRLIAQHSN